MALRISILAAAAAGLAALTGPPARADAVVFPANAGIIDVKRDLGAKGDGVTDDTGALRQAMKLVNERGRYAPPFIYFPKGTYLVTDTIWSKDPDPAKPYWWSGMCLMGEDRETTFIRLKDDLPAFRHSVINLTVDVSQGWRALLGFGRADRPHQLVSWN